MNKPIIIDNGSSLFKIGLAGDPAPKHVFTNAIGYPKPNSPREELLIGPSLLNCKKSLSSTIYPVEAGHIVHFDDFTKVLDFSFSELLHMKASEHPIILTNTPGCSAKDLDHLVQIIFETFNAPSLFLASPAFFDLYASGSQTGIAIDIGASSTHTCAVINGEIIPETAQYLPIGGNDIDKRICQLIPSFSLPKDISLIHRLKENLVTIKSQISDSSEIAQGDDVDPEALTFAMPDGTSIDVSKEASLCAEILFDPSPLGLGISGIQKCLVDTINSCNEVVRTELSRSVVTGGGTAKIPGLPHRLKKETKNLGTEIEIDVALEGPHSAWWGASRFGSMSSFSKRAVPQSAYHESGISLFSEKYP